MSPSDVLMISDCNRNNRLSPTDGISSAVADAVVGLRKEPLLIVCGKWEVGDGVWIVLEANSFIASSSLMNSSVGISSSHDLTISAPELSVVSSRYVFSRLLLVASTGRIKSVVEWQILEVELDKLTKSGIESDSSLSSLISVIELPGPVSIR